MAYVPPHLRKKAAAAAAPEPARRGVRFIGNATGSENIAENTGTRYSPGHRAKAPARRTLKATARVSPNRKPAHSPSHSLRKAAPKFSKAAMEHLGHKKWKTRKSKRHGKRKGTRRRHLKK